MTSDPIALSALQHWLYCPRQCALIHVEQAWAENRFTAEGRVLHEATAEIGSEKRRGVRVVTAMPLVSRRLGVSGIADLVEMHKDAQGKSDTSILHSPEGLREARLAVVTRVADAIAEALGVLGIEAPNEM